MEKLEERFCDLVDCTYKALLERSVDDVRLFRSTFLSLDVSRKHEHREFIHDHLMRMDKETTFDDLWMRLADYCNFMNFDLLEHVVRRFAIEDLKQKMKSYAHDLQSFRKATRLCDFINCWPVRGEPSLRTQLDLREFIAKMKHDWDSCTLEDLEKLKGVITHKFFLPEFALQLRKIKKGCITIIWLIPAPFMKVLQEDIETTSSEFFMEHKIETINIDGKDCYPSPTGKSVDYPNVQDTSQSMAQSWQTEIPSVGMLSEKLHSFKASMSGEELLLKETHRVRLAEEITSTKATSTVPSKQKYSILPQTTPTKHTRKLQQTSYIPALEFDPAEIYFGETLLSSNPRSGYSRALVPPTPAEKYVREKCVDETSGQVKLLPSVDQYLNKAEVEANPSLPTKYNDYLSSTPAIRAALYTTFNAKMAAEVFIWSQHTKSPPPTTMTELFTAFTLKTLVDHLSTHPMYHKKQLKVTTFSDLPTDVYMQFQDLCRMAYEGILNRQQLVFSVAHFPAKFAPLGLMQEIPQLYTEGRASSFNFIHLTLQEHLAAIHISQLPVHEQASLMREHLNNGHFKMTLRFWAGLTKLANIPPDISRRMLDDNKLNYFHFLFEAKNISLTTRTLGLNEVVVKSHYSWTPLDYYVTGHAISHSNCPWSLDFMLTPIDDENFELFCQGCAALGGTRCRGHISHAYLWNNDITSKSIQSFVNIPTHILQDMQELQLYDNKLNRRACNLLAKVALSMSRLEKLWLGGNPIGVGGAVELIKVLCGSCVKDLVLFRTGIGDPDCEALCELLKSSHSLKVLSTTQNNLSSESVASIITGLSHNSSLTRLRISNSHFSMANVNSLSSILRDQSKCTLTHLDLEDCHISGQGASDLASALCKNSTLQDLDLNRNPIGVKGASSMSDMLQQNTSLEKLHLIDNSVGEGGVRQLINSLKHNQTLRFLWLPGKYKSETSDHRIIW